MRPDDNSWPEVRPAWRAADGRGGAFEGQEPREAAPTAAPPRDDHAGRAGCHRSGPRLPRPQSARRRLVRHQPAPRQRRRHQPGRAGVHGGRPPARPRHATARSHQRLQFMLDQESTRSRPGLPDNRTPSPHGPMYGHGFATLFLAEVYGMVQRPRAARASCATSCTAPSSSSSTARTTRAAGAISRIAGRRHLGDDLPDHGPARGPQRRHLRAQDDATTASSTSRMPGRRRRLPLHARSGGPAGFARTAAGVVALYSAGIYKGRRSRRGSITYAVASPAASASFGRADDNALLLRPLLRRAGDVDRRRRLLDGVVSRHPRRTLPTASDDGSWIDQICPHYGTAMACIILQMPNNYLPILQK